MDKANFICTACKYKFKAHLDFKGKCPYCGNGPVKKHVQNDAQKLVSSVSSLDDN